MQGAMGVPLHQPIEIIGMIIEGGGDLSVVNGLIVFFSDHGDDLVHDPSASRIISAPRGTGDLCQDLLEIRRGLLPIIEPLPQDLLLHAAEGVQEPTLPRQDQVVIEGGHVGEFDLFHQPIL